MKQQINIFIVSPDDVAIERNVAKEVCYTLDDAIGEDIEIEPILWEYHPLPYHQNPQESIDPKLDKCDIFIVILWHKLGSVIEGYEGAITKSKNVTGTQYEIEKIIATQKESIYFYFKTQEKHFASHELEEAVRQKQLLQTFLEEIHLTKGSTKHGYHEFESSDDFRDKLTSHLKKEVERLSGKKISIKKIKEEQKHITKKWKYSYIILLFIVIALVWVGYIKYGFSLSSVEIKSIRSIEAKKSSIDVLNKKDKKRVKEIPVKQKVVSKTDASSQVKQSKNIKLAIEDHTPVKYVKIKNYFTLESEKIREYSTNPYYVYYKKRHPKGFSFSMAQWKDLSTVSRAVKEAFILEKDKYSKYINKELISVTDQLLHLPTLDSEALANLFYRYANSDDRYLDLTETQMKEKLVEYMETSKNRLTSILHALGGLEVSKKQGLEVGIKSMKKDLKRRVKLECSRDTTNLVRAAEPYGFHVSERKKGVSTLWYILESKKKLCEDVKEYRLVLINKKGRKIVKEFQCN